jgi:hypothetical protein
MTVKGHPNGPITQSTASVKALLAWKGRACDPLPEFVEDERRTGPSVLVLSTRKEVYYLPTSQGLAHAHSRHSLMAAQQTPEKVFPLA